MYLFPETINPTGPTAQVDLVAPPYRVHETLLEKGSGSLNEDALVATNQICVVCDGATSLLEAKSRNKQSASSGGQRAAAITASVFSDNPTEDLLVSARRANSLIRKAMLDVQVDLSCREQLWSTSFVAVQRRNGLINWCQIGDCALLLVHADGTSRLLTDLPNQDKEVLKIWQQIGAEAEGTIHQELAGEIASVRRTMNQKFGSLNGEDEAMDFLSWGRLEDNQVTDILLFSDGLFPPSADPGAPLDKDNFLQLYRGGGLQNVRNHVRSLQCQDPRCHRYPRFKKFDDISAIALRKKD